MSIRKSGIDDNGDGTLIERDFKEGEVIGVFTVACRNKSEIEG